MKKTFFKRGTSAFLALLMCFSAMLGIGATTAYAAGEEAETVMIAFPRDGDSNYSGEWGHSAKSYMNGWSAGESRHYNIYGMGSWYGNICYCIEPGTPLDIGDKFVSKDESYWDNYPSDYNHTITPYEIKMHIGRIFQYGYTGTITTDWRSQNAEDADKLSHAMATQILIWETVVGERDGDFNHIDPGSYDAVLSIISENHPLYAQIMSHYNAIVSGVQKHTKLPSFCSKTTGKAQNIELEWNGTKY